MLHEALAAAATLVALAFALSTLERWLARRRPHELAWTISLFFFAVGSFGLWLGAALGWNEWNFKLFYLFGAILNVPFLALGTMYLLGRNRRREDVIAASVALASAFAAGIVIASPLTAPIDPDVLPQGSAVFGPGPRILAGVASGVAATYIIGAALWSAGRLLWRKWQARRHDTPLVWSGPVSPTRLALANVLIAIGTLIEGTGGTANSVLDAMTYFAIALAAGIVVIFVGFLLTNTPVPVEEWRFQPVDERDEATPLRRRDAS
jgi:hypothetical protein